MMLTPWGPSAVCLEISAAGRVNDQDRARTLTPFVDPDLVVASVFVEINFSALPTYVRSGAIAAVAKR